MKPIRGRPWHAQALALALLCSLDARIADAQSGAELSEARALFGEALRDQDRKDYRAALVKLRRVQAVRDTVPVRYRIALCLEAAGRLLEAQAELRTLKLTGSKELVDERAIIEDAAQRLQSLADRVPSIIVRPADGQPIEIVVDGRIVRTANGDIPLDPGDHTVIVTRSSAAKIETSIRLAEASHVAIRIPFAELGSTAALATAENGTTRPVETSSAVPDKLTHPARAGNSNRGLAYAALGSGAALGITALLFIVLRESAISEIQATCPEGLCPRARSTELETARSRALTFGPVAAIIGGLGVLGLGAGVSLLLIGDSGGASQRAATGAVLRLGGEF